MKKLALACLVISWHATATAADSTPVPKTMQAIAIDAPGDADTLKLRTLPVPAVEANEVLIAVHSAGVAIWDIQIRKSLVYINKPKVSKLPKGMSLEAAGALGASGLTALSGIDRALNIQRGQSLIIHGASGAVGTLALQIAKVRGARVLATASGDEGIAVVRRLGADAVVDGRNGDITAAAHAFAPEGVDAVLALAGGDALKKCLAALRSGGRVAYPNGVEPVPKPRAGMTIIPYDALFGDEKVQLAQLNEVVEAKPFDVPIAASFSLADAAAAHRRVEAGRVPGKVILKIR